MSTEVTPRNPVDAGAAPRDAAGMAEQEHAALFRIQERYAATEAARARLVNPYMLTPGEAADRTSRRPTSSARGAELLP